MIFLPLINASIGEGDKGSGRKEEIFWWGAQKISPMNISWWGLWAYGLA
jgi:hypothetical protein